MVLMLEIVSQSILARVALWTRDSVHTPENDVTQIYTTLHEIEAALFVLDTIALNMPAK